MEHLESQIGAADVSLTDDVLDAIDQIVTPGRDFSWGDSGYIPPEVVHARLRRRPG